MFNSLLKVTDGVIDPLGIVVCLGVALVLGLISSIVYMKTTTTSKNFVITLALLPAMVQAVVLLVNGNLGASIAVMGTFSLVRFRSVPGSSKEISSIFLAMAIGLATGMGYVTYAVLLTIVLCSAIVVLSKTSFGEQITSEKQLKVLIPEDLDYTENFDDLFAKYMKRVSIERVKTTNMGSMFELVYRVELKDPKQEKALIDELRCRNGNLSISCSRYAMNREEL